jgi:hypothetical protein
MDRSTRLKSTGADRRIETFTSHLVHKRGGHEVEEEKYKSEESRLHLSDNHWNEVK